MADDPMKTLTHYPLTVSEGLFEQACKDIGLRFRRIRTAVRQRPDYKVSTINGGIVVEVKEVGANAADLENDRQLRTTGRSFGGVSMGRLRPLVKAANKQLRPWGQRHIPTIVALYDTNLWQLYTEDHHVKSLFGDLGISIPRHGKGGAAQDVVFGINQTLAGNKNQSISAVLTIREVHQAPTKLALFHNPYARLPLARGCADMLGVREVDYKIDVDP